jgi:hypothetical protein
MRGRGRNGGHRPFIDVLGGRGGRGGGRACSSGSLCWNLHCTFVHPRQWNPCDVNCNDYDCKKNHPPGRRVKRDDKSILCKNDVRCWKPDCPFKHPNDWSPCMLGEFCENCDCISIHPPSRIVCRYKGDCLSYECRGIHPPDRVQKCEDGDACMVFHCWGLHPARRVRPCRDGAACLNKHCRYLHPTVMIAQDQHMQQPQPFFADGPQAKAEAGMNPVACVFQPASDLPPAPRQRPRAKEFIPGIGLVERLRPTAKEFVCGAKAVAIEEEQSSVNCIICYEDLKTENGGSLGTECTNKHVFCDGCFVDQIKFQVKDENVGDFIKANRRIVCCMCLPAAYVQFDDAFVALKAGSDVFAQYRQANETAIEVQVCRREQERNRKAMIEMREATKSSVQKHRLTIAETVLTLCCPRCKAPFIDFEGCFAVRCSACTCNFCAWCLLDCGDDAHAHVKRCPKSLVPGGYYGQLKQFNEVHAKRRQQEVAAYLRNLSRDEMNAVKEAIAMDIKDLGFDL